MKRQIRRGVFETNSSSVHTLTIVSKEDFERFKKGELRAVWGGDLVDSSNDDFEDADSWESYGEDYEYFEKEYTTNSGETVVAFGYHGESY